MLFNKGITGKMEHKDNEENVEMLVSYQLTVHRSAKVSLLQNPHRLASWGHISQWNNPIIFILFLFSKYTQRLQAL